MNYGILLVKKLKTLEVYFKHVNGNQNITFEILKKSNQTNRESII